jgi:hypothetical protein
VNEGYLEENYINEHIEHNNGIQHNVVCPAMLIEFNSIIHFYLLITVTFLQVNYIKYNNDPKVFLINIICMY